MHVAETYISNITRNTTDSFYKMLPEIYIRDKLTSIVFISNGCPSNNFDKLHIHVKLCIR